MNNYVNQLNEYVQEVIKRRARNYYELHGYTYEEYEYNAYDLLDSKIQDITEIIDLQELENFIQEQIRVLVVGYIGDSVALDIEELASDLRIVRQWY